MKYLVSQFFNFLHINKYLVSSLIDTSMSAHVSILAGLNFSYQEILLTLLLNQCLKYLHF